MAARWKLVQSFLREATENPDFSPVAELSTAYAKLRTIQRGAYNLSTGDGGLVQISSRIGETEFAFSLPAGCAPAEIMETAETALQLLAQCATVDEARALLVRSKSTRADFSRLRL